MRHLFLAESDYAACGAAFHRAMLAVGEESRYVVGRQHMYCYPHQEGALNTARLNELGQLVDWAEWIWVVQSDLPLAMGGTYGRTSGRRTGRDYWIRRFIETGKHVGLLHGGGYYRDNRDYYRDVWAPTNPLSLCYEADLMGSFEREHLVIPPLDPQWVPRVPRHWTGLRVGHYPSRPTDKGSEWIVPMCIEMGLEFETSVTDARNKDGVRRLPWTEHLLRMAKRDVVIDQIKPTIGAHAFGEWVSTATEVAMMGRIPIANSLNPAPYLETYGRRPGIHICNDPESLATELERLRSLSDDDLEAEQHECFAWASTYHDLESTGELVKRLCEQSNESMRPCGEKTETELCAS
jgi:hypothetical protein